MELESIADGVKEKKKVYIVLNPVAGLTKEDTARQEIEDFTSEHNWDCEIYVTSPEDDLRGLVQDALKKNVDLVIASGGDGTIASVVSGMVNSQVPLAILPAGTGNALARNLGIPLNRSDALNLLIKSHRIQALDVMEINHTDYFVLNVSIGISSLTMRNTGREEKRRFGMLAYLWNGVSSIANPIMHRFLIQVDGKEFRISASEVMIANARLFGMQPQLNGISIDPNDARLDLFIVRGRNLADYFSVLTRFLFPRRPQDDKNIRYIPIHKTAFVQAEFPMPLQADGEDIGVTPVELKLIPSALLVIVPHDEDKTD